jgi:hypothetical protein
MKISFAASIAALSLAATGLAATAAYSDPPAAETAEKKANPNDWLLNAPDDEARFKLLQSQLRGFSASMVEVGDRYQSLYDALGDKNFELAEYHWEKIKEAIQLGYSRRPKRQTNADSVFIDATYEAVMADIKSGDTERAWKGFAKARAACMECHDKEKVEFMNKQPLFRSTAAPKP